MDLKKIAVLISVVLLAAAGGCRRQPKDPPQSVLVMLVNNMRRPLTDIVVDYGTGQWSAPIHKDHEISEWIKVTGTHPLKITFRDGDGFMREVNPDRPLSPDMAGGLFSIYIGNEGKVRWEFRSRVR